MYTIEEAKLCRPHATYHIATGTTREYDREQIIRALENDVQAAQARRAKTVRAAILAVWEKYIGRAFRRAKPTGKGLPV